METLRGDLEMSKKYVATVTGIRRTDNQPFEQNTLFTSKTAAENYARLNKTAYPGQILSVQSGNRMRAMVIQPDMSLLDLTAAVITSRYFTPESVVDGKLYIDMDIVPAGIVSPDGTFYGIIPDKIETTGLYVMDIHGIDIQGIWQVKA